MAEFKCLKKCYGKSERKTFEPNEVYELTVARVKEIEDNIDSKTKWKGTGPYFERIDESKKQEKPKEEPKKEEAETKSKKVK